jgi:phage terminase large subunit-like protein
LEQVQRISFLPTGGIFAPLGKDHKRQDGFDPSKGILDEYHEHPTDGIRNIIKTGMTLRRSERIDIISTAGYNLGGPCAKMRKLGIDILNGDLEDDRTFVTIHELDDGDDWKDEKVWVKPNPTLGLRGGVKMETMRSNFADALNEGGETEVGFKTKNLNMWVGSRTTWIPAEVWDLCNKGKNELKDFSLDRAYAALDLASKIDIAAFTVLIPHSDRFTSFNWFFCPEKTAAKRSKKDRVDYLRWAEQGFLTLTPGDATDYNYIIKKILEVGKIIGIKSIAYDQWNATHLANQLDNEGANMIVYPQNYSFMSEPTKELEKLIIQQRFNHQGNPVLRWMNSNVMLMTDSNDNIKIDKSKSEEKVDGMITNVMALGMYLRDKMETTVYETRGVIAR